MLNAKCAIEIKKKTRLNRSNRIEGYESVWAKSVECKSEVEPKKLHWTKIYALNWTKIDSFNLNIHLLNTATIGLPYYGLLIWMSFLLFKKNPHKKRWHSSATNRGCMSLSVYMYQLEHGRHVARLHCCRHRHAYAPTSNTASHDNHEKMNPLVSFTGTSYG